MRSQRAAPVILIPLREVVSEKGMSQRTHFSAERRRFCPPPGTRPTFTQVQTSGASQSPFNWPCSGSRAVEELAHDRLIAKEIANLRMGHFLGELDRSMHGSLRVMNVSALEV